ncbi:hypothetical protein LSUB1_G007795 [Lachnellula subtilissima]|uniref:Uncharacterized protein n=1 Tax=Lachnellula subtilissima TaxID=602034 RepID=A0A8H8U6V5_9HELO|nr:hypothetical protein LSUB1_G007795 [Lachnellula subtilissima]
MAPTTSNAAKALQQNRQRPAAGPRQIVPAIPLSFVQKRQKSQSAKPKQEIAVSPAPPPPVVDEPSPSPTIQPEMAVVNGSTRDQSENLEEGTNDSASVSATEEGATESTVAQTEASVHESLDEPQEASKSSETTSSELRSPYHMPAPFVPAKSDLVSTMSSERVQFPPQANFNGQSPMHHAHPIAGSVMFGGYSDSNASSPVPQSAGNVPPYPYPNQQPRAVGRHGVHQSNGGHSHHLSNGVSPMNPPPGYYTHPEGNMNPAADSYARRQMVSFAPPDGYSPSSTPSGMEGQRFNSHEFPSTPHSFHGSQSSAPSEQDNGPAFYGQYPTAVISNGSNGHIDDVRLYHSSRSKHQGSYQNNPNHFPSHLPAQPPMPIDNLDGLVNYVQSQFNISEFADYTVELRYADDRVRPDYVPGHGLMFARSPTLKTLMTALARENHGGRTLLIESDDRFVRSDAFWMALHRLYGGPLLDFDTLGSINTNTQLPITVPGTPVDRFDLALGYAAAGSILQIPPVITRGVEIACNFVQWVTIEKALDFALDGGLDAQWILESSYQQPETPSTYGPAANMLIRYVLEFIITGFPPNFELNDTVDEDSRNRRLPAIPEVRPNAQNARLSRIKFGDHQTKESTMYTNANSMIITLSKVLLGLPFHLLKYVLESPRLGNVDLWATATLRQKVMDSVIQEREKRRVKVYNSSQVSNADRQKDYAVWQAVGWQEYVEVQGGKDGIPILARKWVDYVLPAHQD